MPRASGSAADAKVRRRLEMALADQGYDTSVERFGFDPRRPWLLLRAALVGLGLVPVVVVVASGRLGLLAYLLAGAFGMTSIALLVALFRSDRLFRLKESGRLETANVVGRLGAPAPRRVVLVAHHDSKSQPLGMIARASCVVLLVTGWMAIPFEALLGRVGGLASLRGATEILLVIGGLAGVCLAWSAGTWGNRSPGALDNGASVASLLEVARRLASDPPPRGLELVVALTGAEEHMMLGARRLADWLADLEPVARTRVLNLDGIGEPGPIGVAGPGELVRAMRQAADRAGVPLRRVIFPPGSATDGVVLRRAGFPVVELTSGRLGPGARAVHTDGDRCENVSPETMERTVVLIETWVRGEAEGA